MSRHHRKSRALHGDSSPSNISEVPEKQHQAFHTLWDGTKTAREICDDLNNRWIDNDFFLVCIKRERKEKVLKSLSQLT